MIRGVLILAALAACGGDQPTLRAKPASKPVRTDPARYAWAGQGARHETLASRIAPPRGYVREGARPQTFTHWLRRLPLKDAGAEVRLHDGRSKSRQDLHHSVIAIDVGKRDLQQCADAVIRLRAEYLRAIGADDRIRFRYTSGDPAVWLRWREGWRDRVKGNEVTWALRAGYDGSYANFRKYLDRVFIYAGSYSLARELKPVRVEDVRPGDVFIRGGFPGHAMLVVDVAVKDGRKAFLLAQSYMPAQDVHIVRNRADRKLSPWYRPAKKIVTPEWTFRGNELKRWR